MHKSIVHWRKWSHDIEMRKAEEEIKTVGSYNNVEVYNDKASSL